MRLGALLAAGILTGLLSDGPSAYAQNSHVDKSAANLMVVLRESFGANKQDEELKATGKVRAKLPDGKEIEFEMASFEFIGDMHLRFVFDEPQTMLNARPEDLQKLNLTPAQALSLALANIKRVYGEPTVKPFAGGVMQVQGKSPDVDSSYFIDREFWSALLKKHPEGLVVGVPKRGGLIFAPLSDTRSVDSLKKSIATLHSTSERLRVSGALYLFKNDRWSVFQPTQVKP